jgi:ABC-type antimicrobial peptide transport system permease subunit
MLKNYLKTAFRNLRNNKTHSIINITGLSVGMAVAMLIGLWIWDEVTFNRNFKNYDRIAQVYQNQTLNGQIVTWFNLPRPTSEDIRERYGSYFRYAVISTWTESHLLTVSENRLMKGGIYWEPQGPEMLDLKMLKGEQSALKDPQSILISVSLAKDLFGAVDPINKTVKMDNRVDVTVAGVYEDLPHNSSFAGVTYMAPWQLYLNNNPRVRDHSNPWNANGFRVFVQLADNVDIDKASAAIRNVRKDHLASNSRALAFNPQMALHPMHRWHLYQDFENGVNAGGRIQFVWLFGIIGVFVLLLACINFMNLSTARSERRAKEVGIRKAVGSLRMQLISQFFCESMLITLIALVCCVILVQLMLPAFNEIAGKKISIPFGAPLFWLAGISFSVITGLLAGSYPALYLSSFRPVKVLKGTIMHGRFAAVPRKVLVVVQFTVSVILIIGTMIVFRQIQHAKDRPMGYNSNGLIMLGSLGAEVHDHFDAVKQELKSSGAVVEVAASSSPVTNVWSTFGGFEWKGKDPGMAVDIPVTGVSHEYGKTIGWEFVAGRDFSPAFASDTMAFVINESAVKFMGLKDPVGETIKWDGKPLTVIGVIKDMIMESPYQSVKPSFYIMNSYRNFLIIKLNPAVSTQRALGSIEKIIKRYTPALPFNYTFVDEDYARKFDGEARIGRLAGGFALLAVFISCLGLFGMATFMAERRTKEIGVRKVLGASVFNVWQLLSKEFMLLVTISFLIAAPLAYFLMQQWLQRYEYRAGIPWWIFMATAAGALLITLLTVSGQSIKAALINPVKSLRSE